MTKLAWALIGAAALGVAAMPDDNAPPVAGNMPARIEGRDAAPIMGAIVGKLRESGCTVREDSPSSYEVESC